MSDHQTYTPELRMRAVRMVADVASEYRTEDEAIDAVATILGIDNPKTLRKWIDKERHSPNQEGNRSARWQLFGAIWKHPVVSGIVVAVVGGLTLLYSQNLLGVKRMAPHLQVDSIALAPARLGGSSSTQLLPFKIDVKLLNTGSQLAVINSAKIVIQKFAVLPICASQGDLMTTGTYVSNMPTNPSPGQVVNIRVSQVVPSNGADRFDLLLHLRPLPGQHARANVYMYRLHIFLTYNVSTNPIDAGEVLAVLPFTPDAGEYYWTQYYERHPQIVRNTVYPGGLSQYKKCVLRNTYALHSILLLPAMRTPQIAAIKPQLAYSGVP